MNLITTDKFNIQGVRSKIAYRFYMFGGSKPPIIAIHFQVYNGDKCKRQRGRSLLV